MQLRNEILVHQHVFDDDHNDLENAHYGAYYPTGLGEGVKHGEGDALYVQLLITQGENHLGQEIAMISEVSNDLLLYQTEVMLNREVLDWLIVGKLILQVGIFDIYFYRFHLVDLGLSIVTSSKVHDFG